MDWRVCCSDVPQLAAAGVRYYAYIIDSVQQNYASNVRLIIVIDRLSFALDLRRLMARLAASHSAFEIMNKLNVIHD